MGTPSFALPSLEELLKHFEVVGVITQQDKPAGRGQRLTPPPVKEYALRKGLRCFQPESKGEIYCRSERAKASVRGGGSLRKNTTQRGP
jgi:methionyl-tRNA formyltransferase